MSFEDDIGESATNFKSNLVDLNEIHVALMSAFSAGLSLGDVLNAMCGLPEVETSEDLKAAIDARILLEECQ